MVSSNPSNIPIDFELWPNTETKQVGEKQAAGTSANGSKVRVTVGSRFLELEVLDLVNKSKWKGLRNNPNAKAIEITRGKYKGLTAYVDKKALDILDRGFSETQKIYSTPENYYQNERLEMVRLVGDVAKLFGKPWHPNPISLEEIEENRSTAKFVTTQFQVVADHDQSRTNKKENFIKDVLAFAEESNPQNDPLKRIPLYFSKGANLEAGIVAAASLLNKSYHKEVKSTEEAKENLSILSEILGTLEQSEDKSQKSMKDRIQEEVDFLGWVVASDIAQKNWFGSPALDFQELDRSLVTLAEICGFAIQLDARGTDGLSIQKEILSTGKQLAIFAQMLRNSGIHEESVIGKRLFQYGEQLESAYQAAENMNAAGEKGEPVGIYEGFLTRSDDLASCIRSGLPLNSRDPRAAELETSLQRFKKELKENPPPDCGEIQTDYPSDDANSPFRVISEDELPKNLKPVVMSQEAHSLQLGPYAFFEDKEFVDRERIHDPFNNGGNVDFVRDLPRIGGSYITDAVSHDYCFNGQIEKRAAMSVAYRVLDELISYYENEVKQYGLIDFLRSVAIPREVIDDIMQKVAEEQVRAAYNEVDPQVMMDYKRTMPSFEKVLGQVQNSMNYYQTIFKSPDDSITPITFLNTFFEGIGKSSTFLATQIRQGRNGRKYFTGYNLGDANCVAVHVLEGKVQAVLPLIGMHSQKAEGKKAEDENGELGSDPRKARVVHYQLPKKGKVLFLNLTDGSYDALTHGQEKNEDRDKERSQHLAIIANLVGQNIDKQGAINQGNLLIDLAGHGIASMPEMQRRVEVDDWTASTTVVDL